MTDLVTSNRAALHESIHAGVLLQYGWAPIEARLSYPMQQHNGGTRPDWTVRDINDQKSMQELLVSVVASPVFEGLAIYDWPIDGSTWPDGCERDAEMCQFICDRLDITRLSGWLPFTIEAETLVREPRFRKLIVELAAELDRTELLLQHELVEIFEGSGYVRS